MIPRNCFARAAAFLVLVIALTGAGGGAMAAAADDDVFTVIDVAVDATASTAAKAREIAHADGHRQAFFRLVARLVPRGGATGLKALKTEKIASLVHSFEVDQEKTSRVRYLGRLRFRFDRRAVRRFLTEAGIAFAETRSKPLLVLPVYRVAGAYLLWDNPNPWRSAWVAMPPSDGLVPLIVPSGDLADINDISPEQAVRGQDDRLRAIWRRYGAAGAVLALAVRGRHRARNVPVIQVTVSRFGAVGQDRTIVRSFIAAPGQSIGSLIGTAARAMSEQIQEDWKFDNLLRFDRPSELIAVVPLNRLEDWVAMERRLAAIAFVRLSELVSMSRKEATVRLHYIGDEEQLELALAQRDVHLLRGAVTWELYLSSSDTDGAGRPEAAR